MFRVGRVAYEVRVGSTYRLDTQWKLLRDYRCRVGGRG